MRARRPPKRRCPRCGGDHYAWADNQVCRRCYTETRPDSLTLAGMVREQRLERRRQAGIPDTDPEPAEWGGVKDDIPY